ncbi:MAG: hypothetical protein ABS98_10120 [Lysobacteraceae bacterium SCN 69-48]|nr:MAG: hypothetical protein ABS98_10120 [Xanthomonadaceae bacterium SCN 69-48]
MSTLLQVSSLWIVPVPWVGVLTVLELHAANTSPMIVPPLALLMTAADEFIVESLATLLSV